MQIELLGLLTLAIGLMTFRLGPSFAVYAMMLATELGAAAALVVTALGGASIQPAHMLLMIVALYVVMRPDLWQAVLRSLAFPRAGFWLLLAVAYGAVTAIIMPRLFAGVTKVFAVARSTGVDEGIILVPLAPVSGNITQAVYFVGDLVCFCVASAFAASADGRRAMVGAIMATAALNVGFAAVDLVGYWVGMPDLLEFVRTANYRMLDEAEITGLKRIVGSFTEASAFAYATLPLFAFTARLWLAGIQPRLTGTLSLLSLGALALATSSTGYVALGLFLLITYVSTLARSASRRATPQERMFTILVPAGSLVSALFIALSPSHLAGILDFFDQTLLSKMSSQSGVERMSWNIQALKVFLETFGLGAGIGSLRTSSFLIAVVSTMGVIGTITYGTYLFAVIAGQRPLAGISDPYEDAIRKAASAACLVQIVAASIAGAFVDLGLAFFILAALACAPREAWALSPAPPHPAVPTLRPLA